MLGTLAMLAVANIPNLIQYTVTNSRSTSCNSTTEANVAANIMVVLVRVYIPFGLMLVMDIIVFKRLQKSKRRVGVTQMGQRKQPGHVSNKEYSFLISTILIDLTFMLFYTPIAVYVSVSVADTYVNWDLFTKFAFYLFYSCAMLTSFLYSVVTFFLFLLLNRYFRSEVFTLLRLNKFFPDLGQTVMDTGSTNNAIRTIS